MTVTIYSKSGCAECMFTKKYLETEGVCYEERRVDLNEAYKEEVVSLGFRSLPVVKIENQVPFNGYRPDILANLVSE